jgi:hypothetical protein
MTYYTQTGSRSASSTMTEARVRLVMQNVAANFSAFVVAGLIDRDGAIKCNFSADRGVSGVFRVAVGRTFLRASVYHQVGRFSSAELTVGRAGHLRDSDRHERAIVRPHAWRHTATHI